MAGLSERTLPQSMEAEASVLGAVLRDNSVMSVIARELKSEFFFSAANRMVFEAMLELYEREAAVDLVLLTDEMERRGTLEKCGGASFLVSLEEGVTSAHVEYYAKIVRDRAFMRTLVGVCGEVTNTLCESSQPAPELRDWAEARLFDAFQQWDTGDLVKIDNLIHAAMKRIEDMVDGKGPMPGLPTQFAKLDEILCGLQASQFIIIAGRPSMGKTSFALNLVDSIGVVQRQPALFFSLETSREQITQNLLCSHARVDAQLVRRGTGLSRLITKLADAASYIHTAPIYIDDTPGLSVLECKAKARLAKARHGIQMLVVDYLQLMEAPGRRRSDSREQEISYISRSLKGLSRELEIPVIALAQLNRSVESREGHRPRLSDLRESGAIEQDADVILFLHRPGYYSNREEDRLKRDAELIVAKQRNGPTGTVPLVFQYEHLRFESLSREMEPDEAVPFDVPA
ncbi:MAG: replicative DNA helicase [Planctomycetota bacterium]